VIEKPLAVGDWVRFKMMPKDFKPRPLRVREVLDNGMILLDGWGGQFRANLFIQVEPPAKFCRDYGRRYA
jgi:hypothetical protein